LSRLDSDEQEEFIKSSDLCGGEVDNFTEQYQSLKSLGSGTFGSVFQVRHVEKEIFQAMKRMPNIINDY
jgi:serine/threonine protein kinase